MPEPLSRIEYDCTLDEIVDANLRLTNSTKTFRSYRKRSMLAVGAVAGVAVLALTVREAADLPISLFSAVVAAAVMGFAYGYFYDSAARREYRRVVSEQLGGVSSIRCEIELRPDVVWARQHGIEITFPWSQAARVEDTGDAIELWFRPGLVTARNRAFATAGERQRFLEISRKLATASGAP